jgi:hypothetical protein
VPWRELPGRFGSRWLGPRGAVRIIASRIPQFRRRGYSRSESSPAVQGPSPEPSRARKKHPYLGPAPPVQACRHSVGGRIVVCADAAPAAKFGDLTDRLSLLIIRRVDDLGLILDNRR